MRLAITKYKPETPGISGLIVRYDGMYDENQAIIHVFALDRTALIDRRDLFLFQEDVEDAVQDRRS